MKSESGEVETLLLSSLLKTLCGEFVAESFTFGCWDLSGKSANARDDVVWTCGFVYIVLDLNLTDSGSILSVVVASPLSIVVAWRARRLVALVSGPCLILVVLPRRVSALLPLSRCVSILWVVLSLLCVAASLARRWTVSSNVPKSLAVVALALSAHICLVESYGVNVHCVWISCDCAGCVRAYVLLQPFFFSHV